MSIFGIILLSFVIALIIWLVAILVYITIMDGDDERIVVAMAIICIVLWIALVFVGIGLNTENHRLWIAEFEAQKYTIEASIDSETLSGLERIELVTKAAELNGELARRKTEFNLWHHVVFDKTLYDGVELIQIK